MLVSEVREDVTAALLSAHYLDYLRGIVIFSDLNAAALGCNGFRHLT